MKRHPNNMTKEELRQLIFAMSWRALDLGQHLSFTNECLKPRYKKKAYQNACKIAYKIVNMPYEEIEQSNMDISSLGENGIEKPSSFYRTKDEDSED